MRTLSTRNTVRFDPVCRGDARGGASQPGIAADAVEFDRDQRHLVVAGS
jgi:hypothetical protein